MLLEKKVSAGDDDGRLKQHIKFMSERLVVANAENRKLKKELAARSTVFVEAVEENQLLSLAFSACERFIAEPSWSIEEKYNALVATIARAREERLKC